MSWAWSSPSRSGRSRVAPSSWPRTCGSPWTTRGSCWCWCGWTASRPRRAKATTFDGFTYLSSIGTRDAFRGRGLAGLATRHAMAVAGAREAGRTYLGVFSDNEPALRLYTRLGFASVGESPDMLLG